MSIIRKLEQSYTPTGEPGFLGAGHTARALITTGFRRSDPFIMLMDDQLDKKDTIPVGGPHPHAGFETASGKSFPRNTCLRSAGTASRSHYTAAHWPDSPRRYTTTLH